jgi:hypothetical protein
MFLGASIVSIAVAIVFFWLFQLLTIYPASATGDGFKLAVTMTNLMWSFFQTSSILMFAVAGWIIIRYQALPMWLGYASYLVAALQLAGSLGAVFTSGPFASGDIVSLGAFGIFLAWFLVISITLLVRPREAPA